MESPFHRYHHTINPTTKLANELGHPGNYRNRPSPSFPGQAVATPTVGKFQVPSREFQVETWGQESASTVMVIKATRWDIDSRIVDKYGAP